MNASIRFPEHDRRRGARPGQATLLMMVAIMLIAICAISASVMTTALSNTRNTVMNAKSLQTYYIAQAGIQEALASRMIPRSNYLNYLPVGGNAYTPFLPTSGKVYANPSQAIQLIGMYRYMVLGGDPARDPNTGNYYAATDTNLLNTSSNQNFYIVSKGTVCRDTSGLTGVDKLSVDPVQHVPVCAAGYSPDEITLVSSVNLSRNLPAYLNLDVVQSFKTYRNLASIPLDTPVFVPGTGVQTSVNFETAWSAGGAGSPAIPAKVLVYAPNDTVPKQVVDITPGQTTVIQNPVTNKDVIRILFSGPVDYRSVLVPPVSGYNVATCINPGSNLPQCDIQIWDVAANKAYNSNTIIPNFPSSTQVILLPPTSADPNFSSANQSKVYQIRIQGSVADYSGNTLGNPVIIQFKA